MGLKTPVDYQVSKGVAYIRLNRPAVLNALDVSAKRMLANCWATAAADHDVAAAVISGEGRAFCAGSDMKEIQRSGPADTETVLGALPNVLHPFPKPVIAALHGHVLGMGLNLAIHCDIRIVHPTANLGFPEIRHGMISAAGAVALPAVVGSSKAADMLLVGDSVSGKEAGEIGLASRVSADPEATAADLVERIVGSDTRAVAATLALARLDKGPATARFIPDMERARASLG